jgi:hypothetical protein
LKSSTAFLFSAIICFAIFSISSEFEIVDEDSIIFFGDSDFSFQFRKISFAFNSVILFSLIAFNSSAKCSGFISVSENSILL